jgi:hypothetical protein
MPKRPPSSRRRSIFEPRAEALRPGVVALSLIVLLRAYRSVLAPALPPACRFEPSCSAFAREAVERHGAARGMVLALRRLARCHPWHPGGHDPVPS